MSLKELIAEKLARLESVPDALVSSTEKAQKILLKELLKSINALETDALGNIIVSKENLGKIDVILNKLHDALFGSEYTEAITTFAREIGIQANLNNTYFGNTFGAKAPEVLTEIIKTSQTTALKLLDSDAVSSVLLEPLRQQLSASITSGSSITDTISKIADFLTGTDKDGLLLRHVKRVSYDAFSISDRQYTDIFSKAVDATWFLYQGGLLKDSREFCVQRHGHYYTTKEIESWASLNWQGKNPATDKRTIFVYAGGFQCKHALLPVTEDMVPEAEKQRAKQSGFI